MILQSKMLSSFPGVVHGFTGRQLGDNFTSIAKSMERKSISIILLRQVHSAKVCVVRDEPVVPLEGDALVCAERDLFIGMRTADCVPLLFFDPVKKICAAVHAGWKGLVGGVIENTILTMQKHFSTQPQDIAVAIGPALCQKCFEVGPEVFDIFQKKFGDAMKSELGHGDKKHLPLRSLCVSVLVSQKIKAENIELITGCTACHTDQFFSYRKGDLIGRQVAFIGLSSEVRV